MAWQEAYRLSCSGGYLKQRALLLDAEVWITVKTSRPWRGRGVNASA
jgi:hypothetical protein